MSSVNTIASRAADEGARAELVLEKLYTELQARRSSLAGGEGLDPGLEAQARSILAETFSALRVGNARTPRLVAVEYGESANLAEHGELSAMREIDPAEPLMAAEILFGIALPIIVRAPDDGPEADPLLAARVLHHAIWRRFPPGAIAYVEVLRSRLSVAYAEGRQRLSRELHDRIAHGIAAGIQRIEIAQGLIGAPANAAVDEALKVFRSTLEDTQNIAFDLRQLVADRSLDDAIVEYAAAESSIPPILVRRVGQRAALPSAVAEEAFTIVLEAIRNVRAHANDATEITIDLRWETPTFTVSITDNGSGFDPAGRNQNSLGLIGMRERAVGIGARLDVEALDPGARISLIVPLVPSKSARA